jgi:methionine-rich copper-binding protein CopC
MKKRISVLLATVAVMTTMLAVSVAPAFAHPPLWTCTHPETGAVAVNMPSNAKHFFFKEGFECVKQ